MKGRRVLPYLLLFFGVCLCDQSSKFHAEKAFLTWWDANEVMAYHRESIALLEMGRSPASVTERAKANPDLGKAPLRDLVPQKTAQLSTASWFDVRLSYLRNPGAAWGNFRPASGVAKSALQNPIRFSFFAVFSSLLLIFFLFLFFRTPPEELLARTAFCLLAGGTAGNLVDRAVLGYVVDWISFHWRIFGWEYAFPLFNIADVAACIGIGALLVTGFLQPSLAQPPSSKKSTESPA